MNRNHQARRRDLLEELHFNNPFCPFCLVQTDYVNREGEGKTKVYDDNEAELFSLIPRLHPWRSQIRGLNILVCRGCARFLSNRRQGMLEIAMKTWDLDEPIDVGFQNRIPL